MRGGLALVGPLGTVDTENAVTKELDVLFTEEFALQGKDVGCENRWSG